MPDNSNPLNQTTPPMNDTAFPPITDLPPLSDAAPIENQPGLNTANAVSEAPIDMPPVVSPPPSRGKPTTRMVAGILGMVLLIGGIIAGSLLVRQRQLLNQSAAGLGENCTFGGQSGSCQTLGGCGSLNGAFSGTGGGGCTGTLGCCTGTSGSGGGSTSCSAITGGSGGCVPNAYTCNGNYGQTDCPSGQKCGVNCTAENTCSGQCLPGGVGQSCGALGLVPGIGSCANSGICCNNSVNPPPPPGGGGCGTVGPQCNNGWAYWCYANGTLDTGNHACSCSNPPDINAACWTTAPGGNPPPPPGGTSDCHYTNDGTTVGLAGNCTGYTFRALVYTCAGHLSGGRCSDTIVQDTANATSVSIGSSPSCGSKQADLIVTSRPDSLPGDELPGTPRVANFVTRDSASICSVTPPPPTAGAAPSCQSIEGAPAGGPNEKVFIVNATQGSSAINRVRLYYRLTPSNPNSCGATGAAGGWTEVTAGNPTLHTFVANTTGLAAGTYQVAANVFDTAGRSCSGNPGCTGADGTSCANCNGFTGVSCHNCTSSFTIGGTVPPPGGGGSTASCGGVSAYALADTAFRTPLTNAQLSALRVGDKINLGLKGTHSGTGSFTQAEFRVNNTSIGTTTTQIVLGASINGTVSQLFWKEYTIPAGTTSFNIAGSLTHSTLGVVGR